jgi:hypothetical protein
VAITGSARPFLGAHSVLLEPLDPESDFRHEDVPPLIGKADCRRDDHSGLKLARQRIKTLGDQEAVEDPTAGEGTSSENPMVQNYVLWKIKPREHSVTERTFLKRHKENASIIAARDCDLGVIKEGYSRFQYRYAHATCQSHASQGPGVNDAIPALLNSQQRCLGRICLLDTNCESSRFEPLGILRGGPLL